MVELYRITYHYPCKFGGQACLNHFPLVYNSFGASHPAGAHPELSGPDIFLDVCAPKLVYGAIDTLNAKLRVEYMYREVPEIGASQSTGLKDVAEVPIQNRDADGQTEYGLSNVQWQKLIVKSPTCHDWHLICEIFCIPEDG